MFKTVNDMWNYNKTTQNPMLLSNYSADFWSDYRSNPTRYDKLFRRLYLSYKYFLQEKDETISEITQNFTEDVYNHLMVNDKKYSELYRVHVIDDDDYNLLGNYHYTETMDRDTSGSDTNIYGQRSDSSTIGAQSNSSTDTVAPYNTNAFQNDSATSESIGSRSDSSTKGAQTDNLSRSGTEDYTRTVEGNRGVIATEYLKEHDKYWSKYDFYLMIFRDICKELLLV